MDFVSVKQYGRPPSLMAPGNAIGELMEVESLIALMFALVLFAGVFIVYQGLRQRSLQLEMRHKERMAMIERGIAPAAPVPFVPRRSTVASRSLTLGIVVVAIGLALATIISVAAEAPETGLGIGGGIAILGAAFIVNSMVGRGHGGPTTPAADDELNGDA